MITFQTEAGELKLSEKGAKALDALCRTGGDVKLAMAYAKLAERQVRRVKAMPGVKALIVQKARDAITCLTYRAAEKLGTLLDSPSQKVQFEAAERILAIANIRPPQAPPAAANVTVQFAGYVIDLGGKPQVDGVPGDPKRAGHDAVRTIDAKAVPSDG
jgi:hypothetical protein